MIYMDEKGEDFMFPKGPPQLKDLEILNAVVTQREVLDYFEQAITCGIDLMELRVNMYIYNRYAFDLGTIIPYTQILSGLVFLFREEFDECVHKVSMYYTHSELIQNEIMGRNIFLNVFNDINDTLNNAISSETTFDYFIYDEDGMVQLAAGLYNAFTTSFSRNINSITNNDLLKINIIKNMSPSNMIGYYESIYEIFESMRLPFY